MRGKNEERKERKKRGAKSTTKETKRKRKEEEEEERGMKGGRTTHLRLEKVFQRSERRRWPLRRHIPPSLRLRRFVNACEPQRCLDVDHEETFYHVLLDN